jgi:hypothetical protein
MTGSISSVARLAEKPFDAVVRFFVGQKLRKSEKNEKRLILVITLSFSHCRLANRQLGVQQGDPLEKH